MSIAQDCINPIERSLLNDLIGLYFGSGFFPPLILASIQVSSVFRQVRQSQLKDKSSDAL